MSTTTTVAAAGSEGADEELNLQELWYTLLRNRWLVAAITAAVVALAAVYTFQKRPLYQAEVTLRLQEENATEGALSDIMRFGGGSSVGRMETEMVVLRSREVAESVVDSLGLAVVLDEPARARASVLRVIEAPRTATPGVYELTRRPDGRYEVSAEEASAGVRLPGPVSIGAPFHLGNVTLALAPSLNRQPPEHIRFRVLRFQAAVEALRRATVVARVDPKANVLSVRHVSADPDLASQVPNVMADVYMAGKASVSKTESRSTVGFLREQVTSYEHQLERAENDLRSFRERARVVSPEDEATEQVRRLAELQSERDRLRSEREALGKLLTRVDAEVRPQNGSRTSPYRQLASFPVFLSNKAVQDMLQNLTLLENQRAELLVRRTPSNEDVQGIDTRIQETELQLYQIARNYLEGLDSQISSAEGNLSRFGSQLELIPAREVEFARLSRQQKLLSEIYTLLQTKLKEAEIREAIESSEVRVIDPALRPTLPFSPRPVRAMVLATVFGLLLGFGVAFARERLDTKVRTRDDVTEAAGLPVLGLIPRIRMNGELNGTRRALVSGTRERTPPIVQIAPFSPASEAFRALRTSLAFTRVEGAPQVVVVTSAMPGEGKSTNSVNLALSQAQQGTRTLLVDADLRRGTLHRTLGTQQDPGLTHVLMGRSSLDEAVVEIAAGDESGEAMLHFLPAGVFPPNPAEILGSDAMSRLIEQLRERYEMVIFDAAPLNLVTDGAVLARQCDATVLITRTGFTDKRALHHAAAQLQQVRARVGGVVLNDVDTEGTGRYYGYGYGYSYGNYAPLNGVPGRNGSNGKH